MDPITGLWILGGATIASLAALRLKKQTEGFTALDPNSVAESQSRYNAFTSLVNPITNSIIPVGSSEQEIQKKQEHVTQALGTKEANFSEDSSLHLVLQSFQNKFNIRGDSKKSFYSAIQFCQEAGKNTQPFTVYNPDGTVAQQGAVSADGVWKFDEVCGVCLSEGVDELGKRFNKPTGLVVNPSEVTAAVSEQQEKSWPFPRVSPALGKCTGAPNAPVFATNAQDLVKYTRARKCSHGKVLGGSDSCALCYGSDDVFSSVPPETKTMPIFLFLNGSGNCTVRLNGTTLKTVQLGTDAPQSVELLNAKEGDVFTLEVNPPSGSKAEVYGYLKSNTPRSTNEKNGLFTMPLNTLLVVDDESGVSPNKNGRFPRYDDIDLDVATMAPAVGKTRMRLRGTLPFTFVQSTEFPALDCMDGPFQTKLSSANAFSTDQPCFAKGSGPGKYNDECLRARILAAGCTSAGELYKNPSSLNTLNGQAQSLSQIVPRIQNIKEMDLLDENATKQCSGRNIQTKCDPFLNNSKKFGPALLSSNPKVKDQAKQCLAFLYNNSGANEKTIPARVGPTYSGLVTYKNDQKVIKNIYCLPEGKLNPETSDDAAATLARIGDNGYRDLLGIDAIKKFLNDQLELAVNMSIDIASSPDRKAAIANCFGKSITNLPFSNVLTGSPTILSLNDDGSNTNIIIRHPDGRSIKNDNGILRLNRGTEIKFQIVKDPSVYGNNRGMVALYSMGTSSAIRHAGLVMYLNTFIPNNGDFGWKLIPQGSGYLIKNDFFNGRGWSNPNVGSYLSYNASSDYLFIANGTSNTSSFTAWSFSPKPFDSLTVSS